MKEISEKISELEQLSEKDKLPLLIALQVNKDELIHSLLTYEGTDERFFTASNVIETGDFGWTTISTKNKKQYDKLNEDVCSLLTNIIIELEYHDILFMNCEKSFSELRAEIDNFLKKHN